MTTREIKVRPGYYVWICGDKVYIEYTNIENRYRYVELDYIRQVGYIGRLVNNEIWVGEYPNHIVISIFEF